MKAKSTPTAPCERQKRIEELCAPRNNSFFPFHGEFFFFLLSVICSFFAGILGYFFSLHYLSGVDVSGTVNQNTSFSLSDFFSSNSADIPQAVQEVTTKHKASIVGIYQISPEGTTGQFISEDDALGVGVIVTSDGYILTLSSALQSTGGSLDNVVVVTHDRKIYPVVSRIDDDFSGTSFLRIEAHGLKPVSFASMSKLAVGEMTLTLPSDFSGFDEVSYAAISKVHGIAPKSGDSMVFSSERMNESIFTFPYSHNTLPGSPVFTLSGDVLGFSLSDESFARSAEARRGSEFNIVLPSDSILSAMQQLLDNGKIQRPEFGVHYVDMSRTLYLDSEKSVISDKGVYITGGVDFSGVIEGGVASKAGIHDGDVILKIDGLELDAVHDLATILQDYAVGDTVEFTLLTPEKKEKVLSITL